MACLVFFFLMQCLNTVKTFTFTYTELLSLMLFRNIYRIFLRKTFTSSSFIIAPQFKMVTHACAHTRTHTNMHTLWPNKPRIFLYAAINGET